MLYEWRKITNINSISEEKINFFFIELTAKVSVKINSCFVFDRASSM